MPFGEISSSPNEAHALAGLAGAPWPPATPSGQHAISGRRRRSSSGSGRPGPPRVPPNSTRSPIRGRPGTRIMTPGERAGRIQAARGGHPPVTAPLATDAS